MVRLLERKDTLRSEETRREKNKKTGKERKSSKGENSFGVEKFLQERADERWDLKIGRRVSKGGN